MSIFEQASRLALRFDSARGALAVEQLWQLPLQSKSGFDLDSIAKAVNKELKATEEESFVTTAVSPTNARLTLQLEILKHIIAVKKQEAADALAKADKAAKRAKLIDLLGRKQDAALEGMSEEEIKKELAALD